MKTQPEDLIKSDEESKEGATVKRNKSADRVLGGENCAAVVSRDVCITPLPTPIPTPSR